MDKNDVINKMETLIGIIEAMGKKFTFDGTFNNVNLKDLKTEVDEWIEEQKAL